VQEHERIVREVRARLGGVDMRSPTERWHEALLKAEGLVAETTGLEDDETFARHEIAKGLAQRGKIDPLLHKALVNPKAAPPEVTLEDAARLYAKDKGLAEDKNAMVRLDRTLGRLSATLFDQLKAPRSPTPLPHRKGDRCGDRRGTDRGAGEQTGRWSSEVG